MPGRYKLGLTVEAESEEWLERGETLAERLERGPLPLPIAIRHAYDVATALRTLHRDGKTHGSVNCRAIELRQNRAALLPPAAGFQPASAWRNDVRGFGWVLQSLFSDETPPPPPGSFPASARPAISAKGVWEAARKLAALCLSESIDGDWNAQKLVNELRLLDLVARQWAWKAGPEAALPRQRREVLRETLSDTPRQAPPKPLREAPPAALPPPTPAPPAPARGVSSASPVEIQRAATRAARPRLRCPRCESPEVKPSAPRSDFEETLELWHMPVLRCQWCSYRYFRFLFMNIPKGTND